MPPELSEWLEADGLGGYASGTVSGRRTRRYHALLLTATTPPTGRLVLVNGAEIYVQTPSGQFPLSTQLYAPNAVHPDGQRYLINFSIEPWPTWTYRLPDGTQIVQELCVPHGRSGVVLKWRLEAGSADTRLTFRPLMSGRDYHSSHHENSGFAFDPQRAGELLEWQTYQGLPTVAVLSNGKYEHGPIWFRNFLYEVEAERGLDCLEDLASPGELHWNFGAGDAVCILTARGAHEIERLSDSTAKDLAQGLMTDERGRRATFPSALHRAADAYLVRRGAGTTIIAGYPWFTDWGRDTFIALRGLCLATGRLEDAEQILSDWSSTVSEGMLPNRFPDYGDRPEFNSVDASLWFVIAVHDYLAAAATSQRIVCRELRIRLVAAVEKILTGYSQGTRFGIRADEDGLLRAGVPGLQLTWMDAKVGDWVVTPRIGKPVEIQALWLNALHIGAELSAGGSCVAARWRSLFERGRTSFRQRFWNELTHCLFDIVDENHQPGQDEASIRPNQLLAVGGLPLCLVDADQARGIVEIAESLLLTPLGLRTLNRASPNFHPTFTGSIHERDGAYHQGTVWPWLMGAFISAWLRVHGDSAETRAEARRRFIEPLLAHLHEAGLGHVSEVADATAPHVPRGCPFQAWSLGELLRGLKMTE